MKISDLPPPVPGSERQPAPSASASEHLSACASSLARELQVWNFARFHRIQGLVAGAAAERGTNMHEVAGKLPFASKDFGEEPYDIRARAEPLAKALGLNGYEAYVITDFVKKRDAAINHLLDNAPGGRDAVAGLDLSLDDHRIHFSMPVGSLTGRFSGLPDARAMTLGPDEKPMTVLVVDYKAGFTERKDATINKQITSLMGLSKLEHPSLQEGFASVNQEVHAGEPVKLAYYGPKELEAAAEFVRAMVRKVTPLAEEYQAGDHDPDPALEAKLDASATTGSHCLECNGRVCCGAMKLKLLKDNFEVVDHLTPILNEHKDLKTMNPDKLSETLAMATAVTEISKLYDRLRDDAEQLTLQLKSQGITVPGTDIKVGSARIGLSETNPAKLHAQLGPVLGGESIADFLSATAKPTPAAVRAHIAGLLGVNESKVEEELNKRLGEESNPLKKGAAPTSVIVTRDIADILDDKRAELHLPPVAVPLAAAPASTAVAVPASAPVTSPAADPATPTEPTPKRRSRKAASVAKDPAPDSTTAVPAAIAAAAEAADVPSNPVTISVTVEAAPARRASLASFLS